MSQAPSTFGQLARSRLRKPGLLLAACGCAMAGVCILAARWLLAPWLGVTATFVFAFPAVVVIALWAGTVPALAMAALCAAGTLFLPAIARTHAATPLLIQATLFLLLGSMVAVLAGRHAGPSEPEAAPDGDGADAAQQRDDRTTLRWLRLGVVLSVLLPWGVFAVVAFTSHTEAAEGARRRVERLAAIAHEHALKLFETTDLLVRQVNRETQGLTADDFRRDQDRITAQLADLTHGLSQVQSVWIVDAQGHALASNRVSRPPAGVSFADRSNFVAHRERAGQVVITPPRRGRVTQEVFFDLSRRRVAADGSFAGLVMVGLYPQYFTDFYRELADSESGVAVTLVHREGHLIARWPEPAQEPQRLPLEPKLLAADRGFFHSDSAPDGVRRIGAFRRIGDYPAVVLVGTDEASALAGWRRDMLALAAFILPLSIGLALICEQALRRTRRHIAAARALRLEARERQRVEAALRQSQKLEAMGHLTGGVAHDFNNLLMVVNLNVTLLRQRLREPGHERQLDAIERSVGAGKKLTRQLLAFSRRQPLLPRVLDLAELMPSLLDLVRPALGSRIDLEGSVDPGTPHVRLDSGELELALINLAVNARDAMPDGGQVRVHVRHDAGFVELAFHDTGVGIAPGDVERVFEPFFTTKPVGAGTGLGLAQVYGLCARAGGTARVESQPGAGTTVLLRFPAVDAPADVEAPAAGAARQALDRLGLRVLLVEDNPDIASATRELLEAAACDVVHVPAPAEALRTLAEDPEFDIVLSDIVMPGGMDGLQLCARLRHEHPRLPVVLMTGYAEKLGEAESQGLVVLPKPFDPALLLRVLREQMRVPERDGLVQA